MSEKIVFSKILQLLKYYCTALNDYLRKHVYIIILTICSACTRCDGPYRAVTVRIGLYSNGWRYRHALEITVRLEP